MISKPFESFEIYLSTVNHKGDTIPTLETFNVLIGTVNKIVDKINYYEAEIKRLNDYTFDTRRTCLPKKVADLEKHIKNCATSKTEFIDNHYCRLDGNMCCDTEIPCGYRGTERA